MHLASPPQVGAGQLIVYEVPLRTFTAHPNSNVGPGKQGTFLGFLDKVSSLHLLQIACVEGVQQQPVKLCSVRHHRAFISACCSWQIPHLVELGVTAVEILPVFEYDELEFQRSPNPRVLPRYLCMSCFSLHRKYIFTAYRWRPAASHMSVHGARADLMRALLLPCAGSHGQCVGLLPHQLLRTNGTICGQWWRYICCWSGVQAAGEGAACSWHPGHSGRCIQPHERR